MKLNRFLLLGAMFVAGATNANPVVQPGGGSSSASAQASARIIRPVHIQNLRPLNFGSLVRGASGTGYAVMAPVTTTGDIPPSVSGGLTAISQGSTDDFHQSLRGPATFLVQGEPNFLVSVTLPGNEPVFMINRDDNPDDKLPVTDFTMSCPPSCPLLLATPSATVGTMKFSVGAKVGVPHDAPAGWYDGQFNVTVTYN